MRYANSSEDAQDILHEGFLKIFEKIKQYKFKGSFEGWVRKIMVNTALEKFRKETYNIVFMDINLPDQRGDEVVMKMKNEFPNSDCAFIALTAESSESLQEVMIKSGISGYLNKPFSSEDLKSIIGKYGINKISV